MTDLQPVHVPLHAFSLATCEPYFSYVHGEHDNGKYIVIYEYTLDEFYDNEWKQELSFYKKKMPHKVK